MAKKFACKDIGMECAFEARAENEVLLMGQIRDHARTAHAMEQIDETTMAKIRAAIKDE
ncbi:MAG: DUF1059 domain-containing protein [Candidatus Micrarchaeota archaeon]|nr:DUF1059 domain-containing protein [Candidatus Micrarchaeota archaeon]